MTYRDVLTGALVETAIHSLLRQAGYAVVPGSIERLAPGLPLLSRAEYQRLQMPDELRLMPDLMILPPDAPALLIEVKWRTRLSREILQKLRDKLARQQQRFPGAHTVIARGVSPKGDAAKIDDFVRVLPAGRLEIIAAADLFFHLSSQDGASEAERLEPLWQSLRPMTAIFERLQGEHRPDLEQLAPLFHAIANL